MPLQISGKLSLPITGTPAANAQIRFRAVTAVGEIIPGAESIARCDASGNYSISIEFARYELATKISTPDFVVHGQVTIDASTDATDLEDLIEKIGLAPVLSDKLIAEFEALKNAAEAAASSAKSDAESAKSDADRAKSEADRAAQITGLDTVNDAIGMVSPATYTPDVFIPFVDDKGVKNGFGDITVSRATTQHYFDKSGVLSEAPIDSLAISDVGGLVFDAYSNLFKSDLKSYGFNYTSSTINESVNGDGTVTLTAVNAGNAVADFYMARFDKPSGTELLVSFVLKCEDSLSSKVSASLFLSNVELKPKNTKTKKISDGVFFKRFTFENGDYRSIRLTLSGLNVGDSLEMSLFQLTDGNIEYPPIPPQEGAVTTVASTLLGIQMRQNIPAAGMPMTIILDTKIPNPSSMKFVPVIRSSDGNLRLQRRASGLIDFSVTGENGRVEFSSATEEIERWALVFDGSRSMIYVNGKMVASKPSSATYKTEELKFGSTVKNFMVFHRALSDDEIAAWGKAK